MLSRVLTVSLVISALMALAFAATAAAGTPPSGQGLVTDLEDVGFTSLSCSDPSITLDDVVFPRGGGTATWTTDGRMYVVQSLDASGIVTTPDGSFPISFAKTYGNKTGLGGVVVCSFAQEGSGDGATFEVTGTATLVRIR